MSCTEIPELESQLEQLRAQLPQAGNQLERAELESQISDTRSQLIIERSRCDTERQQLKLAMGRSTQIQKQVSTLRKMKTVVVLAIVLVGTSILIGGKKYLDMQQRRKIRP